MDSFLIRTKLIAPPTRPETLPRQRLLRQLEDGANGKLILVSAPAGYGKTTLLSKWAAAQKRPFAWLSIDAADNDPIRFLTYLLAALQNVDATLGRQARAMLHAPASAFAGAGPAPASAPFPPILGALIEDLLWFPDPLLLILDDYHLIRAEAVHEIMRFLLDHQPQPLTLVLSTRRDPPLNLPRLRARGQLLEISERDLSFTQEETAQFLHKAELAPAALAALAARTEGWAAGLQLAALSLPEYERAEDFVQAFAGDDRQVADYLLDEVLRHQPPALQDFLLQTSILDRLSGPLCDVVLGDSAGEESGQLLLEKLDAAQLFLVPLDNKREWYRYHHLFADFLRARLQKMVPERLPELHRRASRWHEANGDVATAVDHAFQIPDPERVIHLLQQHATMMIFTGQIATYLGWIERLPQEAIFRHPYLCADAGWAYALSGQLALAEQFVQAGKEALPAMKPFYVALRRQTIAPDEVMGDLLSVQAYGARLRGDFAEMMHRTQEARRYLPGDAYTVRGTLALNLGMEYYRRWDWDAAAAAFAEAHQMTIRANENIYVAIIAVCMQGNICTHRGQLAEAAVFFQQAIDLGREYGDADAGSIPATCLAYRGLTEIHYHRNETAAAVEPLATAVSLARLTGNVDMLHNIFRLRARLALQAGDVAQAEKDLERSTRLLQDVGLWQNIPDAVALQTEILLAQEDVQAAIDFLAQQGITPHAPAQLDWRAGDSLQRIPKYVLLGRALRQAGRQEEARQLLQTLLPVLTEGQDHFTTIQVHLLLALLDEQSPTSAHQARAHLEEAFRLAQPAGFLSPFLALGSSLHEIVRRMSLSGELPSEYAQKVLAALAGQARGERRSFAAPAAKLLTRQETQVLLLLSQGLSSTEAAEELVIAVSTARSYIKNIYRKLDVHSREEAIARAGDLQIL